MASDQERTRNARIVQRQMSSDYGIRAARALDLAVPGPNRDKLIARAMNVSLRTAQHLRSGQRWTTERLNQASRAFTNFDAFLACPDQLYAYLDDMEQKLADFRALLGGGDDE